MYFEKIQGRTFILVLLIFCFNLQVYGDYKPFSVKGGVNYSTLNYGGYNTKFITAETSYKFGGVFYLSWEKRNIFHEKIYLNVDLGMNQKGLHLEVDDLMEHSSRKVDFSIFTLELPITLGVNPIGGIHLYAGSYLSIGFATRFSKSVEYFFITKNTGERAVIDAGVMLGFEYRFYDFLINIRYQQGMMRIYPALTTEGFTDYYENSRQFVFMIGYRLF